MIELVEATIILKTYDCVSRNSIKIRTISGNKIRLLYI